MAKNSITDYSKTAASNTDIQSVDIDENCLPSGINNAIREIMADLADMNDGTVSLTSPSFAAATITGDLTVDGSSQTTSLLVNTGSTAWADANADDLIIRGADVGITVSSSTTGRINFGDSTSSTKQGQITYTHSGDNLDFYTSANKRLGIAGNGDISFYEDTGTTAKLFWDASEENLGLGTTSPDRAIKIHKDNAYVWIADAAGGNVAFIGGGGDNDGRMRLYDRTHTAKVDIQSEDDSYFNGGNVGIGTDSPNNPLTVVTDSSADGINIVGRSSDDRAYMYFSENDGTTFTGSIHTIPSSNRFNFNAYTGNNLTFSINGAERMRIDSSGNVGIGASSPVHELTVKNATQTPTIRIHSGTTSFPSPRLEFLRGTSDTFGGDNYSDYRIISDSGHLIFQEASNSTTQEFMRLDNSGSLLVGTTDTTPYNNTSGGGFVVAASGLTSIARETTSSAQAVLHLNDTGVDGVIAEFAKDGTTVGTIGVEGGDNFYITDNNNTGLNMKSGLIIPCNTNGSTRDNAIDLGASGGRFKDLYLGGGVYLGGTGAANKLDDYEEGTFSFSWNGGGSVTTYYSRYVKIGRLVHINCDIQLPASSSTSTAVLSGLPFTHSDSYSSLMAISYNNKSDTHLIFLENNNEVKVRTSMSGERATCANMTAGRYIFSGSYYTDA